MGQCSTWVAERAHLKTLFRNSARYVRMDRRQLDPEVIVLEDVLAIPLETSSIEVVLLFRMLGDLPDIVGVLQELKQTDHFGRQISRAD
jgi:hypothetical protein